MAAVLVQNSRLCDAMQARYAWAPSTFNPNLSSSSSSGLLASLKDKVKRIR